MKKHTILITFLTTLFLLLAACQSYEQQATEEADKKLTEKAAVQALPRSKEGIMVTMEKEQYTSSTDKITLMIQNDSNKDFSSGVHIFLQKKVNDTWYEFPYKATMFTAEGLVLRSGGTTSLSLLANELKYELTPGEYRATLGGFAAPFEIIKP